MTTATIAVFGATGSQGGSVVHHLAARGQFRVRALTRRPDAYDGPADEAVFADLDDEGTLQEALRGAHGVFLVTNFWQAGTDEEAQGSRAVRAAVAAGVQHFVWSSLPDVEAISQGKWAVPHFTAKAHVDELVRSAGFPQHAIVQAPFYFENLTGMMAPQPTADGGKGWTLPVDPQAQVIEMGSIADLGQLVAGVFERPEESSGKTLSMAAGRYSFADVAEAWTRATGETMSLGQVPPEVYAGFFPGAGELAQMFGYFADHTYMGPDAEPRKALARDVATAPFTPLDAWLATNAPRATT